MRQLSVIFLFIIFGQVQISMGQISQKEIDRAINITELRHPYLYFTDQEKPALIRKIKTDKESYYIFERLKAEGKMLLHMPVEKDIPAQGKNTRADWTEEDRDNKYENYYRTNRDNAFKLAFLYQMTGEQQYADKAFEFADAFCDLTTWTMRAHEFPIIYSRIMPWNVPDDQVNFNFDHYNGDAGRMMAAVYDWLYPALGQAQRDRIRGALLEKVVTRVRGDYEFHWWATAYRCNWCGVCNSGVGLTGLTLLTEHPQLTDIVAESYNRINSMLNELGVNGGWQEGGGYWNYGVHTSSFFADAIKRITNSKYNLFENERLHNNPTTFPIHISLPDNRSLNFEDSGGGRLIGSPHLIKKLATETGNKQAAWYLNMLGEGRDIFDIIWNKPDFTGIPPEIPSIHFRTIDWWVMRSDFEDMSKVLVAGKAGKNDDPHHGHLDIGQFVVYWQGEYFIRDLGSGSYDEKYFDEVRFDYPQASSIGHNVIFVNGEKQISGKYYKQPYNYDVGGEVLDFRTSSSRDYVLMDPTNAYPKKELKNWRRHIILEKPQMTVVVDEVVANSTGSEIKVRFHPGVNFQVGDNVVLLTGKEGKMALIPMSNQEFIIKQGKHASQFVNATTEFSWIDYFDTELRSTNEKSLIVTLIVPVDGMDEAEEIAAKGKFELDHSGNLSFTVIKKDNQFTYDFVNSAKGLVLEK